MNKIEEIINTAANLNYIEQILSRSISLIKNDILGSRLLISVFYSTDISFPVTQFILIDPHWAESKFFQDNEQ